MGGVLTGGREACVACGPNFKPLARLVAEISAEKSFPIVTVSRGPTIGFQCEPAVCGNHNSWGLGSDLGDLKLHGFVARVEVERTLS